MAIALEDLAFEILSLPLSQRARLMDCLKNSLESEPDVERAWLDEVVRRRAQVESGEVEWLSAEDALTRLRDQFR